MCSYGPPNLSVHFLCAGLILMSSAIADTALAKDGVEIPLRTNTKIRHRHTTEQMRRGNC